MVLTGPIPCEDNTTYELPATVLLSVLLRKKGRKAVPSTMLVWTITGGCWTCS